MSSEARSIRALTLAGFACELLDVEADVAGAFPKKDMRLFCLILLAFWLSLAGAFWDGGAMIQAALAQS